MVAVPASDLPNNSVPAGDLPDHLRAPSGPQGKSDFGGAAKTFGLSAAKEGLRTTGALAGGELGAEGGAALGSFGGPLGTLAGGVLGGLGGGVAGYLGMGKLGDKATAGTDKETAEHPTASLAGRAAVDIPMAGAGLYQLGRSVVDNAPSIARAGGKVVDVAKTALKPNRVISKITKPSTVSDVGESIEKKISGNLKSLLGKRSGKAQDLYKTYLDAGKKQEGDILADYKQSLQRYYGEKAAGGDLSPDDAKALNEAFKRVAGVSKELGKNDRAAALGIGALEKERRFLNDIANGYDVKGAEAISERTARDISGLLKASIQKFVGKEFDAADTGYRELSEPINRFNTAMGKKVTAKADEFLPEMAKTDPAQIPTTFFKSRRSITELKALTGGDDKFVEQAARSHAVNQLANAQTSADIEKYISKNNDWLQEVPAVKKQLEAAAKEMKAAERTKFGGKMLGLGAIAGLGTDIMRHM
jgi:hypothetical protein